MGYEKYLKIQSCLYIQKFYPIVKDLLPVIYCYRLEMFDAGTGGDKKLIIGKNCKIGDYVYIVAGNTL